VAQFGISPLFNIEGASSIPVAEVRLKILRSDSSTVVIDTTVAIEAAATVNIDVEVTLMSDPEQFIVELEIIGPEGTTLFRGGPSRVTVGSDNGPEGEPVEIQIQYVGIGSDAAGVRILSQTPEVAPGGTILLTAEAFDDEDEPIPGTPIIWSSVDPALATVPDIEVGEIVAGTSAGEVLVEARLLTGPADTIALQIREQVPVITLTPDTLRIEVSAGGANPESLEAQITNSGTAASVLTGLAVGEITYDQGADWINGWTLHAGTAPTSVSVFLNISGLTPGTYTAHIPITAPEASNSPQDLVVVLEVTPGIIITVTPTATTLVALGNSVQLGATAVDETGNPIVNPTFTWESSAPGVATVDATGRVTAVANGTTTISANIGNARGTATVIVSQVAASVDVSPSIATFSSLGETLTLTALARDANGNAINGGSFTWTSSQPTVASVHPTTGLVTALQNTAQGGPVTITAITGGAVGSASVTINQNVTQISVSPTSLALSPGQSATLTATVLDENEQPAEGVLVAWSSSSVAASVVSTGPTTAQVTASATDIGPAIITATFGALNATASINVSAPASVSVATDPVGGSTTLTSIGDSIFLMATALDGAGAPINGLLYDWQVSNPSVASIESVGPNQAVAVALANGPFNATASTVGAVSGSLGLTVAQAATTINVTPQTVSMNALGRTTQLTAGATDARGNPVPVTWSSLAPGIAGVGATGLVTAIGNGSTTVTASAGGLDAPVSVTVQQIISSVLVTPPTASTNTIGATLPLAATARDPLGNVVAGTTAAWLSNNPTSASVTSTGETTASVTALAVSPGVTITATIGPASGVSTVVIGQIVDPAVSTATVPAAGSAGVFTDVVVQARDASGVPLGAGGANVLVTITGANPSGPQAASDSANGRYGFRYTPATLGTDNIAITINGTAISGSPFTSTVGPGPVSPAASDVALPAAVAGQQASLVITARDQFGHPVNQGGAAINATLQSGSANEGLSLSVTDSAAVEGTPGIYTVTYTPTASGTDLISLTLNGVTMSGSPFALSVNPGPVNATTSTATVPGTVTAGIPTAIVVQGRDAAGNPVNAGGATVTATITGGPNVGTSFVTVDSAGAGGRPGIYTLAYTPLLAGTDLINVTLNGTPIAGTQPFGINVVSGGVSGAMSTATFTPDVTALPATVVAGTEVRLRVQGKDGNGNDVLTGGATVVIDFFGGPNLPLPPLPNPLGGIDNGDGTYDYFYTPIVATPVDDSDLDDLAVTLNGISISGSPFGGRVIPAAIDPALTTVAITNNFTTLPVTAGTAVRFTLTTRDAFGNALRTGGATIGATVSGANGPLDLAPSTVDNGDGTYQVVYTPTIAGTDNVTITVNGVTVQGAPFTGTIVPSFADFAQSTATLTPGATVVAGTLTSVTVNAFDSFGNSTTIGTVQVSVTGANALGPVSAINNADGTFTFSFPTSSGGPEIATSTPDQILVQMDGGGGPGSVGDVSGTPLSLTVEPGPISGINSVASFVPDITQESVVAGTTVDVTIQGKDAFGNDINIMTVPLPDRVFRFNVIGPNGFEVPVDAIDGDDGTWSASYTPVFVGSDILDIRHTGTVGISGNPFNAQIIPGPVAPGNSTVQFSPFVGEGVQAGTELTMTITGRDAHGNTVDVNTLSPAERIFQVNITEGQSGLGFPATDNNDGTWTANHTLTVAGNAIISILYQGTTPVDQSPYNVSVVPGAPAQLEFVTQPTSVPFGFPFNPPVQVAATDAFGNITPFFETVVMAIAPGTGDPQAFLDGPTSAVPVNGIATFDFLVVGVPGTGYQLQALTTSFTRNSQSFDINQFGYVASQSTNRVYVFDIPSNSLVGSIPVGLAPSSLALSPTGRELYVTNSGSNDLAVISTETNSVVTTVPVGLNPVDVAVSLDDKYVYVVSKDDNRVTVLAAITLNQVESVPVGNSPNAIAITPNGAFGYVANSVDGTVTVINNTGFTVLGEPIPVGPGAEVDGGPWDMGMSPLGFGNVAYVVNKSDSLLYSIETAENTVLSNTFFVNGDAQGLTVTQSGDVYVTVTNVDGNGVVNGTCDCSQLVSGVNDVLGLAEAPQRFEMYVTNPLSNRISIINIGQGNETASFSVPNPVDIVLNYMPLIPR
jgi:YVTN family beta-propeller protein